MDLISYPFRLGGSGQVVTVKDGTPEYIAEQLAVLVLTVAGERPLVPGFGLPDPAFADISAEDLNAAVDLFGPDVTIDELEVEPVIRDAQRFVVTWSPRHTERDGSDAVT